MPKHTAAATGAATARLQHTSPETDHEEDHDNDNDLENDNDNDNDNDNENDNENDQDQDQDLSHSGTTGSAPVKRKRLTQACDPCRKKKIKCDGIKPSCANCAKLDIHCTYLPSMKKRGPRQGYIELLEKRLDKMEKMLQHGPAVIDTDYLDPTISSTRRHRSVSDAESEATESISARPDASDARYFGSTSALSHYAPDSEKALNHPMIHNYSAKNSDGIGSNAGGRSDSSSALTKSKRPIYGIRDEIPRRDILDHLIQLFFDSVYYQFPIIHPGSFMKQYREGKVSPNLLNALCAGVARFSTHPDVVTTPSFLAGEPFATNVRASLVDSIDVPTVSHVQALLFLSMFEYGAARGPRAWMFGGMAIRMAQELGLNREDSSPVFYLKGDWVLRETRRRTFWACFTMDVLASSSSGRPRMIDERDCEVLLPSEDNAWHEARPVVTEMLDEDNDMEKADGKDHPTDDASKDKAPSHQQETSTTTKNANGTQPSKEDATGPKVHSLSSFAYLIRILAVLGKVSQYVNRPRTKKSIPPNEPGSEFSIIDAALAAWLQSVPVEFAYSPDNARILKDRGEGCIIIFMHVVYHTSVVLLHRPILAADKASYPMDPHFVDNSVARCAEAAGKVSEVLEFVSAHNYPPRIYISSFFAYPVFTTATIHITNAFAPDAAVAAKARRNLSIHVKILQTMKSFWAMADKFFYIIRDLYSIQSKISSSAASGGIIVPQVVSHNAHDRNREYAADSAAKLSNAKDTLQSRNGSNDKDDETRRMDLQGDNTAPRMVVNSKLASISSFLKSDSGLIALWRRATEMQVIDEANQQKRRISSEEEAKKVQRAAAAEESIKELEEKELHEQRLRMNQLEIQEINQEFERQWKAKLLQEQQQQQSKGHRESDTEVISGAQSLEKRQTDGDEFANPRASKQARVAKPMSTTSQPPHIHARQSSDRTMSGSSGSPSGSINSLTWSPGSEQIQGQSITPPGPNMNGNMTYRHSVLQRPDQFQQLQGQDAYILQPMMVQTNAPQAMVSSAAGSSSDVHQHLLHVYSQQHQQQEQLSQAIDMRQNAHIQQQHQQLQQQRQQAPVSSSLAFGPPGGFNSSFMSQQQQQPATTFQQQQQQAGMFSGPGFGPPLVYGSSYSHNQSSKAQAELTDSIFDFAMPLGDLNFLSSSFQMTPMMMQQQQQQQQQHQPISGNHSNNNQLVGSANDLSSSQDSSSLSPMSAMSSQQQQQQQQQQQRPGHESMTTGSGTSPSATNPSNSTTPSSAAASLLISVGLETPTASEAGPSSSLTDLTSANATQRGQAASNSKSPPASTQTNISPGLHSFMMSDDAFAEMQSTPDSLIRYLHLHHEQQQRQEMQLQQQQKGGLEGMQPVLNQQNSLIYDDYFQWSHLLLQSGAQEGTTGLTRGPGSMAQQQQQQQQQQHHHHHPFQALQQ
ncbi:hypothetical protein EDD11_006933 [Mortierella claussenii]|nr:hypothetical protein EDD11_006933 [Mortierella claussenii]